MSRVGRRDRRRRAGLQLPLSDPLWQRGKRRSGAALSLQGQLKRHHQGAPRSVAFADNGMGRIGGCGHGLSEGDASRQPVLGRCGEQSALFIRVQQWVWGLPSAHTQVVNVQEHHLPAGTSVPVVEHHNWHAIRQRVRRPTTRQSGPHRHGVQGCASL